MQPGRNLEAGELPRDLPLDLHLCPHSIAVRTLNETMSCCSPHHHHHPQSLPDHFPPAHPPPPTSIPHMPLLHKGRFHQPGGCGARHSSSMCHGLLLWAQCSATPLQSHAADTQLAPFRRRQHGSHALKNHSSCCGWMEMASIGSCVNYLVPS